MDATQKELTLPRPQKPEVEVIDHWEIPDEVEDLFGRLDAYTLKTAPQNVQNSSSSLRTFFTNTLHLVLRSHADLEILVEDNDKRYRIVDIPDERFKDDSKKEEETDTTEEKITDRDTMKPVLHIRNGEKLADKLIDLVGVKNTIRPNNRFYLRPWLDRLQLIDFWNNATPEDFENPERFIERQTYQLKDTRLDSLQDAWKTLGQLSSIGLPLQLIRIASPAGLEGPYELRVRTGGDDESDETHAVRYGFVDTDTAVVYAVQMPLIGNHLTGWDNERTIAVNANRNPSWVIEEKKQLFERRRENLKRFNPFLGRKITTETGDEKVPEDLVGVSPAALVSLTTAVAVFNTQGIKHIEMPLYFPWRQHDDQPVANEFGGYDFDEQGRMKKENKGDIDRRIFDQTVKLAQRLAHEVEGISVETLGEEDSSVRLKIDGELKSKRPLLQEVITVVQTGLPQESPLP